MGQSFVKFALGLGLIGLVSGVLPPKTPPRRPVDVWVVRSVLDKKPRMLTLALHKDCYVAYDLTTCKLYKAWKGGVLMDGAPYTDTKEVQPTSWGAAYLNDSSARFEWQVWQQNQNVLSKALFRGYSFKNQQIWLKYILITHTRDTLVVEERPEFLPNNTLERTFVTSNVPVGVSVLLKSRADKWALNANQVTRKLTVFKPLPKQFPPPIEEKFAHEGQRLMAKNDCYTCHKNTEDEVGPSFQRIAQKYPNTPPNVAYLTAKIKKGSTGTWGSGTMNAHPQLGEKELVAMVNYVFTLKPKTPTPATPPITNKTQHEWPTSPGHGAPLEGVHPSYTLTTLHSSKFNPRVAAMAFMPDGRLLVSTWDKTGGVYLLDGVTKGDTNQLKIKRITAGLAEPLGMEVVNGQIFVLQKHELTQLIDHNGDDLIDEYRSICNSWTVSADFHEFAFGLVFKEGFFYATLSMAMRLKPHEKQLPDRGKTIKIGLDGTFEAVNFGLRTPNGIGLGVDNELFVTDNQGQWLPANKLLHVRQGDFHGMGWGWLSDAPMPDMTPPTIWLPQDEIGNSPTEPVLIKEGIFKGQMLHGDVTHGGIKRDFLEKVNGQYQGAVFRFSQGFEAGVNRLRWGPDGALYVGQVGMKGGGWSWKERLRGLQRLHYNGQTAFEMLAVRAQPQGFEIEFTQPLRAGQTLQVDDVRIWQWWYQPTSRYGGPKMDLTPLTPTQLTLSPDRKKMYLEIPLLKPKHVVYFRLPPWLQSHSGQHLWASEAWYTLNHIPK